MKEHMDIRCPVCFKKLEEGEVDNYTIGWCCNDCNIKIYQTKDTRKPKTMNTKDIIKLSSFLFSIGLSVALYQTFIWAYFVNNYHYVIVLNRYGEQHIELIMLTIIMIIIFLGLYYYAKYDLGRVMRCKIRFRGFKSK